MLKRSALIAAVCLVGISAPAWAQAPKVDFNRDVRPILSEHCFQCHGPDARARKSSLRLDQRDSALRVKMGVAAIVPGKPGESELVRRITSPKDAERMPPPEGKKLTAAQIDTLKRWVAEGGEYKGHWAFIAPERPELPTVKNDKWARNPIDRFILARLEREGLKPSSEAPPHILVRRLYLDLTGLPPTLTEVDAFEKAAAKDPQAAYEELVDRLLASPRYGERMALEWLDAARFADTHGYHLDSGRDMTRWRDWVIDSFNKNMPFDQFTVEQLAGDLVPDATLSQRIASGFHRNHMINYEGGAIPAEYLNAYIVDRVNTTATVWLGLTLGCAQCHDHKYDPFTQREYYQLYAFFHNVPENGLDGQKGNAAPKLKVPTREQQKKLDELNAAIAELEKQIKNPKPEVLAGQAAWEKTALTQKTEWAVVKPGTMKSQGGAKFETAADGSVTVTGPNPAREVYTLPLKTSGKVTAIALEALPDDALGGRGPGRSNNGNFVLTAVSVREGDKALKIRKVSADFSQQDYPASGLAGRNASGWAIHPEVGKPHRAVFELTDPLAAADRELTLELRFESPFGQHQIGKFRISVTESPNPHSADALPANVVAALKVDAEKRTDSQKKDLTAYYLANSPEMKKLCGQEAGLKKQVAELEAQIPDAMVMQEMASPRPTFILVRGQYDKQGEKVTAGTPASLPPLPKDAPLNRLGLARWLVAKEHPLTARVAVNRYWQMYFGTGMVKTAEDFGSQGEWPSHPELLDWLAVEFRESGWDVKKLQKLLVLSATYRQSSVVTPEVLAKDPENRLLARMSRLRLQAEFLRDQALFHSGLLNGEIGGKSVMPYQPPGIWEELAMRGDSKNFSAQFYEQSHGKDLYRRTMYTFWKRTAPPPSLITLDAPDREVCTVRRPRTNTPLQALVLMNDPTYVEAARKMAERVLSEGGKTPEDRIAFAFRTATARKPKEAEVAVLKRIHDKQREVYAKDKDAALKLLKVGESPRDEKLDPVELATWAVVCNVILNLDEALTRN